MDKQLLRRQLKKMRSSFTQEYVHTISDRIAEHILRSDQYRQAEHIMGYLSFGNEISVDKVLRQALADKKKVYVPLILTDTVMAAVRIYNMTDFTYDRYGIRSAAKPGQPTDPEKLDLILVPAVAYDKSGNRLGMGAGYYDRFLAKAAGAVFCGIAYAALLQEKLPHAIDDVPVSVLVDENGLRRIIND